ncbi:MAG: glycosyltransferase family 2 protein [Hyphomicrobium sp.]
MQGIAVVIPCYRVKGHVLDVIARVPAHVERIYCIDDACPDGSGKLIQAECRDGRVRVIFHEANKGVGGAVKTGYLAARADGCSIAVKVDGDGQMDPRLLPSFVRPIQLGLADYTKGNRFFRVGDTRAMPGARLFGNAILSFFSKLSTGYWNVFDPANGYTALHLAVLDLVPIQRVADRYFFESDLLFRLNIARCVVCDVPMIAIYADERSNLSIRRVAVPFLLGHARNFFKRIFYSYFLRDFHVASVQAFLGPILLVAGATFGGYHWWLAWVSGTTATAGTVMIAGLMIIVGMQLLLAALSFDIANVPSQAVHPTLIALRRDETGSDGARNETAPNAEPKTGGSLTRP